MAATTITIPSVVAGEIATDTPLTGDGSIGSPITLPSGAPINVASLTGPSGDALAIVTGNDTGSITAAISDFSAGLGIEPSFVTAYAGDTGFNLNQSLAGAVFFHTDGGSYTLDVDGVNTFTGAVETTDLVLSSGAATVIILPTADPHVVGALWNNAGTITISAG